MTRGTTKITPPTSEDYALARQVADWMATLSESEQKSDYLYNLGVYGKAGITNIKGMGIVASAVASYNRELARAAEAADKPAPVSKYVGKKGERLTLKVRLVGRFDSQNDFGVLRIHKFEIVDGEDAGARLTWFGSKFLWRGEPYVRSQGDTEETNRIDPGAELWIKGTVKGHSEYKGVKETTLSRVDVTLSPEETKAAKKAAKRSERPAGEIAVLGETLYAFDIVRADGQLVGWCVRRQGEANKRGKAKPGVLVESYEHGAAFKSSDAECIMDRIERALRGAWRKAFGAPKAVVRYVAVGYRDPTNTDELPHHTRNGQSDDVVKQLSEREFGVFICGGMYARGEPYASLDEACARIEEDFEKHTFRFERREVTE